MAKVFVVRGETNLGNSSWIVGVYRKRSSAEISAEHERAEARAAGEVCYGDEDEDGEENDDWEKDYEIVECEIES